MDYQSLKLEPNIPVVVSLLFDNALEKSGISEKTGKPYHFWSYSFNKKGEQYYYAASDEVHEQLKAFKKNDIIELVKVVHQGERTRIVVYDALSRPKIVDEREQVQSTKKEETPLKRVLRDSTLRISDFGGGYVARKLSKDHWLYSTTNSGWIPEHRFVVAENIGRPLASDEHVHHINGNKSDNRLENLHLMDRDEYTIYHKTKRSDPDDDGDKQERIDASWALSNAVKIWCMLYKDEKAGPPSAERHIQIKYLKEQLVPLARSLLDARSLLLQNPQESENDSHI